MENAGRQSSQDFQPGRGGSNLQGAFSGERCRPFVWKKGDFKGPIPGGPVKDPKDAVNYLKNQRVFKNQTSLETYRFV